MHPTKRLAEALHWVNEAEADVMNATSTPCPTAEQEERAADLAAEEWTNAVTELRAAEAEIELHARKLH